MIVEVVTSLEYKYEYLYDNDFVASTTAVVGTFIWCDDDYDEYLTESEIEVAK
jgi:hypothetical protein